MNFLNGLAYNVRGLILGLRTPKLLLLGLARFCILLLLTIASISLIFLYRQQIMDLLWLRPDSYWILWLWTILYWLVSLMMMSIAAVIAYILAQILFCVFIMDLMSQATEKLITGSVKSPEPKPVAKQLWHLIRQETPRAILPILLMMLFTVLGWLTPFGTIIALITPLIAAIFLAWDNTDLLPARRLLPFRQRFFSLMKSLPYHLGFGLPFLIPLFNSLLLSFAPVGATLYILEKETPKHEQSP